MSTGEPRWSLVLTATGDDDRDAAAVTRAFLAAQDDPDHEVIECHRHPDGPVASLNDGLAQATGTWVAIVDPGDVLVPHALSTVALAVTDPDADVVYTDEAVRGTDGRLVRHLKPDWSPDRLRCQPYTGRLTFIRRRLLDEVGPADADLAGAHEYDLVLRAVERARHIRHVDEVLVERDAPDAAPVPTERAVSSHLARTGFPAQAAWDDDDGCVRLRPTLTDRPLVSIVIPTGGSDRLVHGQRLELVTNCIASIVRRSTYPNYEIVCVLDPQCPTSLHDDIRHVGAGRARVVVFNAPFHFSRKINFGAFHSRGDHLILLNDDTEVMTPDWIEHLLVYGQDPGVGAVGAKLFFADGRIQHAGVVMVDGFPGHPYYGFPSGAPGYLDNLRVPGNYLAVTAACLMTSRDHFEAVGGLSMTFPANYNDVDYCVKLHRRGLRIVWTPEAQLHHFESSSRGPGPVANEELTRLQARWGSLLERDPFYNRGFVRTADFVA